MIKKRQIIVTFMFSALIIGCNTIPIRNESLVLEETLPANIKTLLQDFVALPEIKKIGPEPYKRLVHIFKHNPLLVQNLSLSMDQGVLKKFLVNTTPNTGATYNETTTSINLSTDSFIPRSDFFISDAVLAFILSHENQHALFISKGTQAQDTFKRTIEKIARSRSETKDYTLAIKAALDSYAEDEARAQISGWNGAVDYLRHEKNGKVSLKEVANATIQMDFVEVKGGRYSPKRSLEMNPKTLMLEPTESNVNAKKHLFFYKEGKDAYRLGHGNVTYPNYYGTDLVARVILVHQAYAASHKMFIDMENLGLEEGQLEKNLLLNPMYFPQKRVRYFDPKHPLKALHFDFLEPEHK